MKRITLFILASVVCLGTLKARTNNDGASHQFDFQVRAHYNLGGSAPLKIPQSIRKIEYYNPTMALGIEVAATRWVAPQWGVRSGVLFEDKAMETKAQTKSYYTEIIQGGQGVRGYFSGMVETNVKVSYATIPILAVHKLNERWNLYGGFYFAGAINRVFEGKVYDGTFRVGKPTGEKIPFENGEFAPYDFSSEVNKLHWGALVGAEWYWKKNFCLYPELSYGINSLLRKDFSAISFAMHDICLSLGFGYRF